jgi:predicted CoA-substrate-specific enzyme activase
MIAAGIDIGHQSVNLVILEDNRIIGSGTVVIAGGVETAAKHAIDAILDKEGIKRSRIDRLFATGVGREKVPFAHGHRTEMLTHVYGAHWFFPDARTVLDVGAEGSRFLRCDAQGNLTNFVMNDKCASGAGVFLETVSEMLQIPLSQMGSVSLESSKKVVLTTTCAVFAESEIVAEIHRGSSKEDILWGVHESITGRLALASKRIGIEPELVFTGGVARNIGVVKALEKQLGIPIRVPEDPQIVGALGAAIVASRSA